MPYLPSCYLHGAGLLYIAVCLCLPVPVYFPAQLHPGQDLGGTTPGFIRDRDVRACCVSPALSPLCPTALQTASWDPRTGGQGDPAAVPPAALRRVSLGLVVPCSTGSPIQNSPPLLSVIFLGNANTKFLQSSPGAGMDISWDFPACGTHQGWGPGTHGSWAFGCPFLKRPRGGSRTGFAHVLYHLSVLLEVAHLSIWPNSPSFKMGCPCPCCVLGMS